MVLYGAVCLSKLRFLFQKSKFVCHTLSFFSLGNIKIGGIVDKFHDIDVNNDVICIRNKLHSVFSGKSAVDPYF